MRFVVRRKTTDIISEDYHKLLAFLRDPDASPPHLIKEAGRKKWRSNYYLRDEVSLLY